VELSAATGGAASFEVPMPARAAKKKAATTRKSVSKKGGSKAASGKSTAARKTKKAAKTAKAAARKAAPKTPKPPKAARAAKAAKAAKKAPRKAAPKLTEAQKKQERAARAAKRRMMARFSKLLMEKHQDLVRAYHATKGDTRAATSDGTEDYIDYAVNSYDRDFMLSLTEMERKQLRLVEDALLRLSRKEFGNCLECGQEIPEKRLEVEPWARFCIRCQELDEQGLLEDRPLLESDDEEEASSGDADSDDEDNDEEEEVDVAPRLSDEDGEADEETA
jgi:DnaK suppressor protein